MVMGFNPGEQGSYEICDGPTEETSEYHRANINNYPKKKKFMESFISQQAYIHKKFEEMTEARSYHKLDLDQYINEKDIKKIEIELFSCGLCASHVTK